jgi:hypothetical protein
MQPSEYQRLARSILKSFQTKGQNYENREMVLLANKWSTVSSSLDGLINQLANKQVKSADQLYRLDTYQKFLKQSNFEVSKFNNLALNTVKDGQTYYAHLGIDATEKSIETVTLNFGKLRFDAVNNMIGLTSERAPLYKLFEASYKDNLDKLVNTMIQSTALNYGPEKTARLLAANMDGNLSRALTIARTEQLNLMRTTSTEAMKASGVVKSKTRIEQSDCCDDCADEDGKVYDLDDEGEWHPNCRGCFIGNVDID